MTGVESTMYNGALQFTAQIADVLRLATGFRREAVFDQRIDWTRNIEWIDLY